MNIRHDFNYSKVGSLLGYKYIIGVKSLNSFYKIDAKKAGKFISFLDKTISNNYEFNENSLTEQEQIFVKRLDEFGFLDNGKDCKKGFNEYDNLSNKIFSYKLAPNKRYVKNMVGFNVAFFTSIIILISLLINFKVYNLQIPELSLEGLNGWNAVVYLFQMFLLTFIILYLHELGHFIVARTIGVSINEFHFGLLMGKPIVLFQYVGLPFETLNKKVCVILGGIYMHLICAVIGIICIRVFQMAQFWIYIWTIGHTSMAVTNLSILSYSDGYFLTTNLVGITNLRMNCYKSIKRLLSFKKDLINKPTVIYGVALIILVSISLIGSFYMFKYWENFLCIKYTVFNNYVILAIIAVIALNTIVKIKNMRI